MPTAVEPPISAATPLHVSGAQSFAVEIIEDEVGGEHECAVLFSIVDNPTDPKTLMCKIGFANNAWSCAAWCDRGFPLVDAVIERTGEDVTVHAPCFLTGDPAMQYKHQLVSIAKLPKGDPSPDSKSLEQTPYEQALRLPDLVSPATRTGASAITWSPAKRSNVRQWHDKPGWKGNPSIFRVTASRYPSLVPFPLDEDKTPTGMWSGNIELPAFESAFPAGKKFAPASQPNTSGLAAFRFEDLEVLGFRIDARKLGYELGYKKEAVLANLMEALVDPLNFHLSQPFSDVTRSAVSDFRYRAATYTVMVELLRYGKMKLQTAMPPLDTNDFQSQHELSVRILVGKVDDDTAQARDAATFVPTIFVDNPWSKVLGRGQLGYDKRLANFCVSGDRPLRPDGRLPKGDERPDGRPEDDKKPEPLGAVKKIVLATLSGRVGPANTLLELDCQPDAIPDWDSFEKVSTRLAFGPVSIAPMSWLQSDFDKVEYRRSFARSVVKDRFKEFSSVQVVPVGGKLKGKLPMQTNWITGTMKFGDNLDFARPTGTISLTFHAPESAPQGWKDLCTLLCVGREGTIVMPTGSWYRMRGSMDLALDDDLE